MLPVFEITNCDFKQAPHPDPLPRGERELSAVDGGPDRPRHEIEDLQHPLEVVAAERRAHVAGRPSRLYSARPVHDGLRALGEERVVQSEAEGELDRARTARPALSAAAAAGRAASLNWAGVFDVACQPSPSVTTRRKAPGLSPPTQIGGCGFCTGLGAKPMSRKRKNSPSKDGVRAVHSSLKTRRISSAWRPRAWKGAPRISSSSFHQPTPTPQISRPLDSASMLVSILAMTTGWRWPRMKTEAPSRARACRRRRRRGR